MAKSSSSGSDHIIAFVSSENEELKKKIVYTSSVVSARELYAQSGQLPSPSKDFCQLVITERGVVWRRWTISPRTVTNRSYAPPSETVMSWEEFLFDKSLLCQLESIFGVGAVRCMKSVASGYNDRLSTLPDRVIVKIASMLDLQSVVNLSQVNQKLREVYQSNQLWEVLFLVHQGQPSVELQELAEELSWKKVFFMSRIDRVKELSRRRRKKSSEEPSTALEPSTTFLTEQYED